MDSNAYDLLAKALAGEATPAEQAALDEAVRTNAAFAETYGAAQQVWQRADSIFPAGRFNTGAAWAAVAARIDAPAVSAPAPSRRIALPVWGRWAAAAAVLGIGVFLFRSGGMQETTAAATQVVTLADGSRVTLHQGATLRYPKSFDGKKTRQVALEGRAFFEVTRNPAQPFTVAGGEVDVTVLGTSFEVDGPAARVAVKTGKVQVADHDDAARSVVILPGEQAVLQGETLVKEGADANDLYWQTGALDFNNQSFASVATEISRILEVPVRLDASLPAAVRTQSVKFTSHGTSVEPVLDDLCRITGCRWERDGDGYRILLRAR